MTTIKLKLRNNSNPESVTIIYSVGPGKSTIDNAPQSDLLHWFGDLPKDRPVDVVAEVIHGNGETRFFVTSYEGDV